MNNDARSPLRQQRWVAVKNQDDLVVPAYGCVKVLDRKNPSPGHEHFLVTRPDGDPTKGIGYAFMNDAGCEKKAFGEATFDMPTYAAVDSQTSSGGGTTLDIEPDKYTLREGAGQWVSLGANPNNSTVASILDVHTKNWWVGKSTSDTDVTATTWATADQIDLGAEVDSLGAIFDFSAPSDSLTINKTAPFMFHWSGTYDFDVATDRTLWVFLGKWDEAAAAFVPVMATIRGFAHDPGSFQGHAYGGAMALQVTLGDKFSVMGYVDSGTATVDGAGGQNPYEVATFMAVEI